MKQARFRRSRNFGYEQVVAILFCITVSTVQAQSSIDIRPDLAAAARQVQELLKDRGEKTITVLGIENSSPRPDTVLPGIGPATILPGIDSMLRREFDQLGMLRDENGDVRILGKVAIDEKRLLLVLELTLMNRDGMKDAQLSLPFAATHAAAVAYGGTGSVVARSSDAPLVRPEFHITPEGTLKLSKASPYELQIKVNGKGRPIGSRKGGEMKSPAPEIELTRGETYTIELTNAGEQPVAATFFIDGINSFQFTNQPGQHGDYWILPPQSRLSLKGWYKRRPQAVGDKNVEEFLVTPFEKTKRAELGLGPDGVGAITVVLSKTRDRPPKVLDVAIPGLPSPRSGPGIEQADFIKLPLPPDGTGAGKAVQQKEGQMGNLVAGAPIGFLTIRYRRPVTE